MQKKDMMNFLKENNIDGVSYYELIGKAMSSSPDTIGNVEHILKYGYDVGLQTTMDAILVAGTFEYCHLSCVEIRNRRYSTDIMKQTSKIVERMADVIERILNDMDSKGIDRIVYNNNYAVLL